MALMQIIRGAPLKKKDDASVLIRVVTDDGRVLLFEADPGDFSRGVALHGTFSVSAIEPEVERPRAI